MGALLAGPVGWLVIGYLGSLALLLISAFWSLGELSGEIQKDFTLDNFRTIVEEPVYRDIALRTILIAALVTLTDALLAFPIAFYMAKVASPRVEGGAGRGRADAPLVGLPGEGLRLAHDPQRGGGAQLGARPIRGSAGRASATSPCGSS